MKVWVTSGRLTAELRRKWGLHLGTNEKNRNDHRHHALDAAVIGVTDRGLINRLSREAARDEENEVRRILADIDDPYDGFSDEVNNKARAVIVSHRPNHRVAGQIHGAAITARLMTIRQIVSAAIWRVAIWSFGATCSPSPPK